MNLRYRIIIAFIVVISVNVPGVNAQHPKGNQAIIRFNPLAFLEPQAGPVVGFEYFISPSFSVGTDVGILLYAPYYNDEDGLSSTDDDRMKASNLSGYRIKPEFRYYFERAPRKRTRFFIAAEGIFLRSTSKINNDVIVADNMGNYLYTYLGGYDQVKKTAGGSIKLGTQIPLRRKKDNRAFVEFYAGLGLKKKTFSYKNVPSGAQIDEIRDDFGFNTTSEGIYPSVPAGVKFVFRL